jgi:hypothetical protein
VRGSAPEVCLKCASSLPPSRHSRIKRRQATFCHEKTTNVLVPQTHSIDYNFAAKQESTPTVHLYKFIFTHHKMFRLLRRRCDWIVLFTSTVYGLQNRFALAQSGTCVCQPGEITFALDISLSCDNSTIIPGLPGIEDALCTVTTDGNSSPDDVPVSISSSTVSEIDSAKNELQTVTYNEAIFTYTSYAITDRESVTNGTIPKGLQVSIMGLNAAGEIIINNVVIVFTNDCTIYPVLESGSQIGWTSLVC